MQGNTLNRKISTLSWKYEGDLRLFKSFNVCIVYTHFNNKWMTLQLFQFLADQIF